MYFVVTITGPNWIALSPLLFWTPCIKSKSRILFNFIRVVYKVTNNLGNFIEFYIKIWEFYKIPIFYILPVMYPDISSKNSQNAFDSPETVCQEAATENVA